MTTLFTKVALMCIRAHSNQLNSYKGKDIHFGKWYCIMLKCNEIMVLIKTAESCLLPPHMDHFSIDPPSYIMLHIKP